MLQQTRVAAVIPYYERFLERFPDVRALAEAPQEEVLRLWSGLGYYSRARNLQHAAQQIVAEHKGEFPRTRERALALKGIGTYTAAAILSIAFGEPLAVLDGNVARVIARLDAVRGDLRSHGRWQALQTRAEEMLARGSAGDWNQAIMEFGATLCTPKSPQCLLCPVSRFCQGRKLGIAEGLPEKRKKRATVTVRLVSAVLFDSSNRVLLLPPPLRGKKSQADDHVPSLVAKLWHFPTVTKHEEIEASLRFILERDLRLKPNHILRTQALDLVSHTVTYRRITMSAFVVFVTTLPRMRGAKTVSLDQALVMPISNLTRKIAGKAARLLSSDTRG